MGRESEQIRELQEALQKQTLNPWAPCSRSLPIWLKPHFPSSLSQSSPVPALWLRLIGPHSPRPAMCSPKALSRWSLSWGSASTQIHLFPGLHLLCSFLLFKVSGGCKGLLHILCSGARSLGNLICDRIFELPPAYGDVEKCVPVQLLCWHTPAFCKMCILIRV